jgi:hypothetical protein
MSQPRHSHTAEGAPVTPNPTQDEPEKDEPGVGPFPDPRTPYGPEKGPPVGEAVGEDSEVKPPAP